MINIFVKSTNYNRLKAKTHTVQKILAMEGYLVADNQTCIDGNLVALENIRIVPSLRKKGVKNTPKKD